MKHLLDGLQDELTEQEQQLVADLPESDTLAISKALTVRTALKAKSIELGLYLSDSAIDTLTHALLSRP